MHSFKLLANLPLAVFLCVLCVSGLQSENVKGSEEFTVFIDFEKYQQLSSYFDFNKTGVCANSESEEYRKCGNRCVLGCRYASSSKITLTKAECDDKTTSKCVEGCFCKDGLIRHQNKCIPAKQCPVRRNKAMEFMSEPITSNKTENPIHIKSQNHTHDHSQVQKKNQTLMVQTQLHVNNPKIFGFPFFNRGCQNPFGGCPVSVPVVHNYDQNSHKKENKHQDRDRPNKSNQSPVVVHIHGDGTVEGTGLDATNDDNNGNNNSGGNGGGQKEWNEGGTADYSNYPDNFGLNDGFSNYGNGFPGYPGFANTNNFAGINGIRGSGNSKGQNQASTHASPSLPKNSTSRAKTYNFGLYSLTFNPGGTRTLHVFGLGSYVFIADGTIISSNVGPKITIPFETMIPNMGTSQSIPSTFNDEEDEREQDASEEDDEWQGNRYQTPRQQMKPQKRPLKKPQYVDEEENSEEEQVIHKYQPTKPSKQNDEYIDNQHGSYQLQYQNFLSRPYTMNTGAPVAAPVQFIPFNYYPIPPSNDGSFVTVKPAKKKTSENRQTNSKKPPKESNKHSTYIHNPLSEYETVNNLKPPKKSSKKEKPAESAKLNPTIQPEQPTYFNYVNGVSNPNYQNQPNFNSESGYSSQNTVPNGPQNSFMPFNIPFNGQQPNGISGFPSFIPNQPGFNGANDYSSQFAQNNGQLNQFNPFNAPFNTESNNKMRYQNNPSFNNPYVNQPFNGFNTPF